MAGHFKSHLVAQSFIFGKEDGVPILLSNTQPKQKFHVHENEVYERKVIDRQIIEYHDGYQSYVINWSKGEKGQWVLKHCLDPSFHIHDDVLNARQQLVITAHVTPKRWTEYCLRFA